MDYNINRIYTMGDMVEHSRKMLGISRTDLFRGIYNEDNKQDPLSCFRDWDQLTWDYILGRLGISQQVYEGYIFSYEQELYELHLKLRSVTGQICYARWLLEREEKEDMRLQTLLSEGRKLLRAYRERLECRPAAGCSSMRLHQFFLGKMEEYLLEGAELMDHTRHLGERRLCIADTWKLFHKEDCFDIDRQQLCRMYLAPAELECLLQMCTLQMDEGCLKEAEECLRTLWDYRNHHLQDGDEQAKIYPYVALQLAGCIKKQGRQVEVTLLEEALDLAVEAGRLCSLVPLMELLLEEPAWKGDRDQLFAQRSALVTLGTLSGANLYGIYPMFSLEDTWVVNEVVKKRRRERKLSQETLGDGILSQNWCSLFERGSYIPRWRTVSRLLERLELPSQRRWTKLDTDDVQALRLQQKCYSHINRFQYELLDEYYRGLRKLLNCNSMINKQFCAYMDMVMPEMVFKKNNLNKRHLQSLEHLRITESHFLGEQLNNGLFSEMEKRLFNSYACSAGDKYKSRDLLEQLINNAYCRKNQHCCMDKYQLTLEINYWIVVGATEEPQRALLQERKVLMSLLQQGRLESLSYVITCVMIAIADTYPNSKSAVTFCKECYPYALSIAELERTINGVIRIKNLNDDFTEKS